MRKIYLILSILYCTTLQSQDKYYPPKLFVEINGHIKVELKNQGRLRLF